LRTGSSGAVLQRILPGAAEVAGSATLAALLSKSLTAKTGVSD
jgi:hypothetical protein